jgi:hypothetical protein
VAPDRSGSERPTSEPASLGAALEFAALGAGVTLAAALLGALPAWFHNLRGFQSLYVLAFGFYLLALVRLRRYAGLPRLGLAVGAVAIAARIVLLPVAPSLSGDIYRYLWEGRVAVAGGNPYRQSPDDPALAALRDREIHPRVNHAELAAIYPPLAEAGFALVARLSPTVLAMKLWIVLHDIGLVLLLIRWAGRGGESAAPAIAYAWNPLVLIEYAGTGHNDPTAIFWLVLALVLARERPTGSALALAAGAMVKLAPLAALPFLWIRWPWRARLLLTATLALGFGWYLSQALGVHSGLAAYWGTWRNNDLAFHYLELLTGSFAGARAVALLLTAAVALWASRRAWQASRATRAVLGSGLLLGPVLHPWYLGWILALESRAPSLPWVLLSLTATLNYGVLAVPGEGRDFHLPLPGRWVEYGIPLALALLLGWRSRSVGGRATRG